MKALALLITASVTLATSPLAAQGSYYGSFYPKSAKVSTQTTNNNGFGLSSYHNSARSGSSSTSASCYVALKHQIDDIIGLTLVSNYNLSAALVPDSRSLRNFLLGGQFSYMLKVNVGLGKTTRYNGSQFYGIPGSQISPGTWGFGVKANIWSKYSTSSRNPLTGHEVELKYIHAYQPGANPRRFGGSYHSQAWVRDNLFTYSLAQPALPSGKGVVRRWKLGSFSPRTDASGNVPYRYLITGNANLNAEGSGIYFIASSDESRFLSGSSVTAYASLPTGWMSQELRLPPGRSYSVVVRDGRSISSLGKYASTGAQVFFHIARYY